MSQRIIPQIELGSRVGGVKELATRVAFYNGIANSLMVAALYYGSNPTIPGLGIPLQTLAPSIAFFYLFLIAGGFSVMIWEHIVMVPAQASYNQEQQFNKRRSPIRRDVHRLEEKVDRLIEDTDD